MSERDNTEQKLRDSEYRYRNMFQAMAVSFWELDFKGVGAMLREMRATGVKDLAAHFAANPAIVRDMMAATRVLDVNDLTVTLFGGGDKAPLMDSVEPFWPDVSNHVFAGSVIAAVSGKPSFMAECKLRAVDGREFETLFTACFPAESVADGKLLIGVIDVSERVRAQEMLQRVQAEFAHAARVSMLGELTASIAHEVNQPLAAIATNASAGLRWLNRPEPNLDEARTLIANVGADARRAADIVARVRDMAQHRKPERGAVQLNAVIGEALAFVRHEMQHHEVALVLDLAPDLPIIDGDRTQLQQVIVNLAVNAIQAMAPSTSRQLIVRSASDGEKITIAVEDCGPGIPPENLPRLFESFFTTKDNGMGMGLAICRSIIEAHGGSIEARNLDCGATFVVTLPASA
ncbi:chemotaxis regulator [alpha proteobacterium U9-1i]|nr:chemotaxis regulator [alpha proteobacterium U9-1i]